MAAIPASICLSSSAIKPLRERPGAIGEKPNIDNTRALGPAVARPDMTGIGRHWHNRKTGRIIEGKHTLIAVAGTRFYARSLREDQQRTPMPPMPHRRLAQFPQCPHAARSVNRDTACPQEKQPNQRQEQQFLFITVTGIRKTPTRTMVSHAD